MLQADPFAYPFKQITSPSLPGGEPNPEPTTVVFRSQLPTVFSAVYTMVRPPGSIVKVTSDAISGSPLSFTANANGDVVVVLKNANGLVIGSSFPISFKSGDGALLYEDTISIINDFNPAIDLPSSLNLVFNARMALSGTSTHGGTHTFAFQSDVGYGLSISTQAYKKKETDSFFVWNLPEVTNLSTVNGQISVTISNAEFPLGVVRTYENINPPFSNFTSLVNTQFESYDEFLIANVQPITANTEIRIRIFSPSAVEHKTIHTFSNNEGKFEVGVFLPVAWQTSASINIDFLNVTYGGTRTISVSPRWFGTANFAVDPITAVDLVGYKVNGVGTMLTSGVAQLGNDSLFFSITGGTSGERGIIRLQSDTSATFDLISSPISFVVDKRTPQLIEIPYCDHLVGFAFSARAIVTSNSTPLIQSANLNISTPISVLVPAKIKTLNTELAFLNGLSTLRFNVQKSVSSAKVVSFLGTSTTTTSLDVQVTHAVTVPANTVPGVYQATATSNDRANGYVKEIEVYDQTYRLRVVSSRPTTILTNNPNTQILRLYSGQTTLNHVVTIPGTLTTNNLPLVFNVKPISPYLCVEIELPSTPWISNNGTTNISVVVNSVTTQFAFNTESVVQQTGGFVLVPSSTNNTLTFKGVSNGAHSLSIAELGIVNQQTTADAAGVFSFVIPNTIPQTGLISPIITVVSSGFQTRITPIEVAKGLPSVLVAKNGTAITDSFLLPNTTYDYTINTPSTAATVFMGKGVGSFTNTSSSNLSSVSGVLTTSGAGSIKMETKDKYGNVVVRTFELGSAVNRNAIISSLTVDTLNASNLQIQLVSFLVGSSWFLELESEIDSSKYLFSGVVATTNETLSIALTNLPTDNYRCYISHDGFYKNIGLISQIGNTLKAADASNLTSLRAKYRAYLVNASLIKLPIDPVSNLVINYLDVNNFTTRTACTYRSRSTNTDYIFTLLPGLACLCSTSVSHKFSPSQNNTILVATESAFASVLNTTTAVTSTATIHRERLACVYKASTELLVADYCLSFVLLNSTKTWASTTLQLSEIAVFFTIKTAFGIHSSFKVPSNLNSLFLSPNGVTKYWASAYSIATSTDSQGMGLVTIYLNGILLGSTSTFQTNTASSDLVYISNKGQEVFNTTTSLVTNDFTLKALTYSPFAWTETQIKSQFIATKTWLKPRFKSPYLPLVEDIKVMWSGKTKDTVVQNIWDRNHGGFRGATGLWANTRYPVKQDNEGLYYLDCNGTSSLYVPKTGLGSEKYLDLEGKSTPIFFYVSLQRNLSDLTSTQCIFSIANTAGTSSYQIYFTGSTTLSVGLGASTLRSYTYPISFNNSRMDIWASITAGAGTNLQGLFQINGQTTSFDSTSLEGIGSTNRHQLGGAGIPYTGSYGFKGRIYFAGLTYGTFSPAITKETTVATSPNDYLLNPFVRGYSNINQKAYRDSAIVMSQEGLSKNWQGFDQYLQPHQAAREFFI